MRGKVEKIRSTAWKNSGRISPAATNVRGVSGPLLPLMARDAEMLALAPRLAALPRAAQPAATAAAAEAAGLADYVMDAIGRNKTRRFAFNPFLAAAAAAIFVVGISFGIFFARINGDSVTVRFVLDAPEATSVYLAGDFNAWSGEGYKLSRSSPSALWEISVKLKKDKTYVYNFIVNGDRWIADPKVPTKIDDGFGGFGSLLRL